MPESHPPTCGVSRSWIKKCFAMQFLPVSQVFQSTLSHLFFLILLRPFLLRDTSERLRCAVLQQRFCLFDSTTMW